MRDDMVDRLGRIWVWWKGSLYRHCGMAWTESMILRGEFTLPRVRYDGMCEVCCPDLPEDARIVGVAGEAAHDALQQGQEGR